MRKKLINQLWCFSILFFLGVVIIFLSRRIALAQIPLSLTVFPAVQDKEVVPGRKTRLQVQFRNGSDEPISGTIKTANYVIQNNEGAPLLVENTDIKPKYAAASWVKPAYDKVTIPPQDFITVDLAIDPPVIIDNCGNYAIVYFESQPQLLAGTGVTRESASSITAKVGALLNFSVAKQTCREKADILNIDRPAFQEYGPIKIKYNILNQGNIHLSPKGMVVLSNIFGNPVDQQKIKEQRIFPETMRLYENTVGQKWMLGRYRLDLAASYGEKGQVLKAFTYVWVFPWRVALVTILTIIVIILIIKNLFKNIVTKEITLEEEVEKEKEEIEKLKTQLRKKG